MCTTFNVYAHQYSFSKKLIVKLHRISDNVSEVNLKNN